MFFLFASAQDLSTPTTTIPSKTDRLRAIVLLLSVCSATLMAPSQASNLAIFEARDVFGLEYADDPQVSANGKQVAYVRVSMNIMTDNAHRAIWQVDADGNNHQPLVSGKGQHSHPRWSPSGDRLAYLSKVAGKTQLHVRWLETGATAKLTTLAQAPSDISWAPNGQWIAFTREIPSATPQLGEMPEKPQGATWADPALVIDRMTYRRDGEGNVATGRKHLFVMPAQGGTPRQLTTADYPMKKGIAWTHDSRGIFFSGNRSEDHEYQPRQSNLFKISLLSGELEPVTQQKGAEFAPAISPDGGLLAYLASADQRKGYNPNQLMIMNLQSGESRSLTTNFDRSIDDFQWSKGGKQLWIQYVDQGITRLARMSLQGEQHPANAALSGTSIGRPYASGAFSVNGDDTIVATIGSDTRPADLARVQPNKSPLALTDLNSDLLGSKTLASAQRITWLSSHDGKSIEGWVMTPPEFDPASTYPLILEIHGGPHTAYGPNFSTEAQLYAAAGYIVFYANPRGSTSYGEAFANSIDLTYPGYDYDDLMAGVDDLLKRGYIDHEQLFVTGGSGGGVLTAWIVGKTDRFKAAAVAKPVINWASFVLTADLNYYFATTWFETPPWEDIQSYWDRSPLSLVGKVSTPTLLLTGELDYRTPISETEQYYQALKHRGIDTLMVRIPGASHSIYKRPSNLIAKVNNILAWFERYR
ncbi:MAG: S9 family peptidase [Luminiphilus sp.]|nr:S9 family peptidase [Luminiphilus sp.]